MGFMNYIFSFLKSVFVPKQKIGLLSKEAIKEVSRKMDEINKDIILQKIAELEKHIDALSAEMKEMREVYKQNQEILVYLCTTNEELLNIFNEAETVEYEVGMDNDETDDDYLNSHWNFKKENTGIN